MQWDQVIAIIGSNIVLFGIAISITISLFCHSDNRSDKLIEAIRQDIKDFHKTMAERKD